MPSLPTPTARHSGLGIVDSMDLPFKVVSTIHAALMRATGKLGSGSEDGSLLVLNTTGAKSGKARRHPLKFFNHEGGYVVIASKGGSNQHPAWFHNLVANPDVSVLVDRTEVPVKAELLREGPERDALFERMVGMAAQFADYQKRSTRTIPVIKLTPTA